MTTSVLAQGTLLCDRYEVGRRLGRGGMADVHAGRDLRLQRDVAIKLLRPEVVATQPEVRARFEAEARSAARLAHPNVVAVYDTGEHEGLPFIVMERLPGETLADRIKQGPVDLDWLRRVAGDVLGALGAAHAAGMVHRDVKPGNILLAEDGRAKVADFGIAKSLDGDGPDLTATNLLIGTPAYLASEQVAGAPATPRTDLYALGVVLYEAASGRKPFSGDTPVAVAYNIEHAEVEPLAALRPDVDGSLSATVGRAMERDPSRRFGSAEEMSAALGISPAADETLEQIVPAPLDVAPEPTRVGPAPLLASSGPGFGRRPPKWLPAAIVAALLVLTVAAALALRDDDGADPAEAETRSTTTVAQRVADESPPVEEEEAPARPRGKGKEEKEAEDTSPPKREQDEAQERIEDLGIPVPDQRSGEEPGGGEEQPNDGEGDGEGDGED